MFKNCIVYGDLTCIQLLTTCVEKTERDRDRKKERKADKQTDRNNRKTKIESKNTHTCIYVYTQMSTRGELSVIIPLQSEDGETDVCYVLW